MQAINKKGHKKILGDHRKKISTSDTGQRIQF